MDTKLLLFAKALGKFIRAKGVRLSISKMNFIDLIRVGIISLRCAKSYCC